MNHRVALRALLPVVLLSLPCAAQTTWFVDAGAAPPGNGTAGSPYASLAFALAQPSTVGGDTLSVAPGTYAEHVDFLGKAVTVQGQGPGVVIDGQWTGPCVRFTSGEGPASVLRDVRLTKGGGAAVAGYTTSGGGGVLCVGSSPTLERVDMVANGSSALCTPHYGGGMFLLDGSPTLVDCAIDGNYACEEAAGVIVYGASSPTFTGCSISGNVPAAFPAAPQGAGVSSYAVPPHIATFHDCDFIGNQGGRGPALSGRARAYDCLFQANRGTVAGGAVFNVNLLQGCTLIDNELFCDGTGAEPEGAGAAQGTTLVDCAILNNRGFAGGGLFECTATGCLISGNEARTFGCETFLARGGGAMWSTLVDCVIEGNSVVEGSGAPPYGAGGGINHTKATGCLIVGNIADDAGGVYIGNLDRCTVSQNEARFGVDGCSFSTVANNSIVWGNGTQETGPTSTFSYCCVKGGIEGTAIIDIDPQWWLASGGDWTLTPISPCIDSGNPSSPLDPDGSPADMGWKPFDAGHTGGPAIYCTASTSALGCTAQIAWTGTPSLSGPDDFHVLASSVEAQRVGLLMVAHAPGAIAAPGGTLCLSAPLTRTPGQFSGGTAPGCDGVYDFHVSHAFLVTLGVTGYGHVCAQYWYRSPGASGNAALSRGLEFVVLP